MTVKNKIPLKEAFQKGFLENRKVFLRPVLRGGKMITNPDHVAFFQYEGASNWFQLPVDRRNVLVRPFETDEEQLFFEEQLDANLSVHKKESNYWSTFFVKIVKDYKLMHKGYEFDLSDPIDNLRYRVMKIQPSVAPDWDSKYSKAEYRFALVDDDYEEKTESDAANNMITAYTYLGTIQGSANKMQDFLGLYLMETMSDKLVPVDARKEWLIKEIKTIIEKDIQKILTLIKDPNWEIKKIIFDAIKANAITKEGRNKYNLPGEGVSYTYPELITYLIKASEIKSDVFLKIKAQIKMNK